MLDFMRRNVPGLIADTFDNRDIWADEILAGETTIPKRFRVEELPYDRQFSYPFCVAMAVTTLAEYRYKRAGLSIEFSEPHLFYNSDGTKTGSGFRANLETARVNGLIEKSKMPINVNRPKNWYEEQQAEAKRIPFTNAKKIEGYVRVQPDAEKMKSVMIEKGPLLIGVKADNNYYSGRGTRTGGVDNHAILLTGWDENSWHIFDSLSWVSGGKGYGTLSFNYALNTSYAITELPSDWKEVVAEVRNEPFANALNHYGKRRDLEAEQLFAALMLQEFKKFNNQSVLDAAGRFWTVLISAGVYGGYNLSYTKWGRWMAGDLINFVYHWRRTGQYIFDLNEVRK